MHRNINQFIPLAIAMKELHYFGSSKLSLSLDGVLDELEEVSSGTKYMCYI